MWDASRYPTQKQQRAVTVSLQPWKSEDAQQQFTAEMQGSLLLLGLHGGIKHVTFQAFVSLLRDGEKLVLEQSNN